MLRRSIETNEPARHGVGKGRAKHKPPSGMPPESPAPSDPAAGVGLDHAEPVADGPGTGAAADGGGGGSGGGDGGGDAPAIDNAAAGAGEEDAEPADDGPGTAAAADDDDYIDVDGGDDEDGAAAPGEDDASEESEAIEYKHITVWLTRVAGGLGVVLDGQKVVKRVLEGGAAVGKVIPGDRLVSVMSAGSGREVEARTSSVSALFPATEHQFGLRLLRRVHATKAKDASDGDDFSDTASSLPPPPPVKAVTLAGERSNIQLPHAGTAFILVPIIASSGEALMPSGAKAELAINSPVLEGEVHALADRSVETLATGLSSSRKVRWIDGTVRISRAGISFSPATRLKMPKYKQYISLAERAMETSVWICRAEPQVLALCVGPPTSTAEVLVIALDSKATAINWARAIGGRLLLTSASVSDADSAEFSDSFDMYDEEHAGLISFKDAATAITMLGRTTDVQAVHELATKLELKPTAAAAELGDNLGASTGDLVALSRSQYVRIAAMTPLDETNEEAALFAAFSELVPGTSEAGVPIEAVRTALLEQGSMPMGEEEVSAFLRDTEADKDGLLHPRAFVKAHRRWFGLLRKKHSSHYLHSHSVIDFSTKDSSINTNSGSYFRTSY